MVIHAGISQAVAVTAIHEAKDFADKFLRLPRLPGVVIVVRRLLVGLISLAIQTEHSRHIARDAFGRVRRIEKCVELFQEIFPPAEQFDQTLNVMWHEPEILPAGRLLAHVIVIRLKWVIGRNPRAVHLPAAHETGRGVEHVRVIMRAGEKHFVVIFLAEFFGELGERVIVPAIFQSFVHAGVTARFRRTRMFHEVIMHPALLHVFGEVTARAGGIGSVLAEKFINGSVIERQPSLPIAEIHEHRMIAVK